MKTSTHEGREFNVNAVVVITTSGKRVMRKFELEGMGEGFKLKTQKHFPNDQVHLISLTNHIPMPADYIPNRQGTHYCPYCGDERRYYPITENGDTKLCCICHISTNDFYVRKYNNLWQKSEGKIQKKKRTR